MYANEKYNYYIVHTVYTIINKYRQDHLCIPVGCYNNI